MLKVSKLAIEKLIAARKADSDINDSFNVRISVKGGGCSGMQHELAFEDEIDETDIVQELDLNGERLNILIDEFSILYLNETEMDYVIGESEEGFKFSGGAKKTCACGSSFSV